MNTILTVENGDTTKTIQGFLKSLLTSGIVEALLVPMRTPSGTIAPALVTNPEFLASADPLAPAMPVNAGDLAAKLSARSPKPKLGAVLRSCEARALIELVKLQQASLDDAVIIAVDCAGTFNVPNNVKLAAPANELWKGLFKEAAETPEQPRPELRQACKMCEKPVYEPRPDHDIAIHLFGYDPAQQIGISLPQELADKLALTPAEPPAARNGVVEKLQAARIAIRDAEFASIRALLETKENHGTGGIQSVFAACIRCHNCMNVCPLCYCKQCVFKSQIFDHNPGQYLTWAKQKGAIRLPADTVLFHMTRLNHMVLSCIGCGMCTEACPAELPVGLVFRAIGQRVQAEFDYEPGRSLDDPLPLVTFKADEWQEVGE